MAKVFAVVVTYNGMKWIDKCLGSLNSSMTTVKTIVIDNASSDGTPSYIKEHFPNVHLINSAKNYGFAKGNNIGIRYALDQGADYIFLLNQDAWLNSTDTISKMLKTIKCAPDIGIVCPINMDGNNEALEPEYATDMPGAFVSDAYRGKMKESYDVNYINAAAWLISPKCIQTVGGFDTSMFIHYGEDNNYCQRVIYHGLRILIDATCSICHDTGSRTMSKEEYRARSFKQDDLGKRIEWCNLLYDIDIDKFISSTKHSIKRMRMTLRFNRIADLKHQLAFFMDVKNSREQNKKKEMSWL